MTVAAKLRAEGRLEGEARGKAEGEARGKLMVLQEIMDVPISSDEDLAGLAVTELQRRYEELHRQYKAQFKRP